MLKDHYNAIYIPKENNEIRTGNMSYHTNKGRYLKNVDIETNDDGFLIHGYLCKWKFHSDMTDSYPDIDEKDWYKFCTEKENFYMTEIGFLGKWLFRFKPEKRLKKDWYMKKKNKAVTISFTRENMPPVIHRSN